jgi:RNA polymerase sigma-B factor
MRNYADRNALTDFESLAAGSRPRARVLGAHELGELDNNKLFGLLRAAEGAQRDRIREALVVRHGGLVRWLAAQYANPAVDIEELCQVGYLGLVLAIDRFDPDRGFDFLSFARPTVQGEMRRWFRDKRRWIRLPRRLQEAKAALKEAEGELLGRLGREPSRAELAEHTGLSLELVIEALDADDAFTATSLDAPVGGEDGESFTVADCIGSADERLDLLLDCQVLRGPIAELSERDRQILYLRFYQELTQSQIGEQLGCSQMQVSRLLARALKQLREAMNDDRPAAVEDLSVEDLAAAV